MSLFSAHRTGGSSGSGGGMSGGGSGNGTNVFFGRVAGALPDALGMAPIIGGGGGGVGERRREQRLADARACCIGLETLCCCQCLQCGACAAAVLYFVDVLSSSGGELLAPLFAERKKTKTNRNNNNSDFDFSSLGHTEDDDDASRPEDRAVSDADNRWPFSADYSHEPRDENRDAVRISDNAFAEPHATSSPSPYGQWTARQ